MKFRGLAIFALLLTGILFAACNNDDCDPNLDCYSDRPDSGLLFLNVTINSENTEVPIAIYEGNVDDSVLVYRDTIADTRVSYYLAADRKYGATARYRLSNFSIIALDGDKIDTDRQWNCDDLCFTVESGDLSLELKN